MTSAGAGSEPLTGDDLRQAAARLDAQLQDIAARLVLHDGRFAALGDRINQAERRTEAFQVRTGSDLAAVDRRLDGLHTRLDSHDALGAEVRAELIDAVRLHRAALSRTTALGLVATVVVTGLIVGAAVWVLA